MKRYFNILVVTLIGIGFSNCSSGERNQQTVHEPAVTESESLYQMDGKWTTQNGDTFHLSELKGKIPVVAMVFTSCTYACPKIIEDIQKVKRQVPVNQKEKMVYVLISFDTERDTPERLKEFAISQQLDDQWLLLHGDEDEVREMSMLLNVKYKKQPNGDFAHSNEVTLLDTQGAIIAQVEGLGKNQQPIVDKIKAM
ncbi:SCO family protein [Pedobacter arcticus]|uniref:SCO family protein n=1 Tax=Pedobacter arcticus TaxID=752140 RepID=UPI00030A757A|nr:SCO family protein [Pedobacter arcticus]